MQKKTKKGPLNALQAAQLIECINAGMNAPRPRKAKEGQGIKPAPLFGLPGSDSYTQADLF